MLNITMNMEKKDIKDTKGIIIITKESTETTGNIIMKDIMRNMVVDTRNTGTNMIIMVNIMSMAIIIREANTGIINIMIRERKPTATTRNTTKTISIRIIISMMTTTPKASITNTESIMDITKTKEVITRRAVITRAVMTSIIMARKVITISIIMTKTIRDTKVITDMRNIIIIIMIMVKRAVTRTIKTGASIMENTKSKLSCDISSYGFLLVFYKFLHKRCCYM